MPRSKIKKPAHRVALAFPTRNAHLAEIVQGIADYARQHGNWAFTTSGESFDLPVRMLSRWQGDGVITALASPADLAAAKRLHLPVVNFVSVIPTPGIPGVTVDQSAIGRLAAEHLLSCGFRQFAFYGFRSLVYSTRRLEAFAARLAEDDLQVVQQLAPYAANRRKPWEDELVTLGRWLASLPTPLGVFAANDARARLVADACRLIGRKTPDEIGIIGVDNFQIACEFGSPTLSSIACDWKKLGFESAALLDQLMRGGKSNLQRMIPPLGVVPRESTDVLIIKNPLVACAVEFAKANLSKPFGVKAMVDETSASRRSLELGFLQSLGCTPGEYLLKLRVEKAKTLLSQKGSLTKVATATGFTDLRHLRRSFVRFVGITPREYMVQNRAAATDMRAAR